MEFSHEEYTLVVLEKKKPGQYYEDFDALNVVFLSEKYKVNLPHSFFLIYTFLKGVSAANDRVIGFLWRSYVPTSLLSIFLSLNRNSFFIMEHLVPEHYSKIFHYLLKFSFTRASRVFFVSNYALKGFNISNGEVLYNYLDIRKKDLKKSRTDKIVWVGRNCHQKYISDLISFAKVNEKYSIDVFGFNYYPSDDLPKNISIQGKVNEIDYSAYRFLLITSHYESQALVIHEALNNGLRVICRQGLYPFIQEFYPMESLYLYDNKYTWKWREDTIDYVWKFNDISIEKWKKILSKLQ
jgi:hypothetical protein